MKYLKKLVVKVHMNKDEPWTIEPWHIRASLRKINVHVLNDVSIEIPEKPISGPDLTLEGKSFIVYITVSYIYFSTVINININNILYFYFLIPR